MAPASRSGAAEGAPSKEAFLETVPPGIGGGVAREETSTPSRTGVSLKQEKRDLPTAGEADNESVVRHSRRRIEVLPEEGEERLERESEALPGKVPAGAEGEDAGPQEGGRRPALRNSLGDILVEADSPFDGRPTLQIPGKPFVYIRSPKYVKTTNLLRAVAWGRLLFGATGFALLDGEFPEGGNGYYVVRLEKPVSSEDIRTRRDQDFVVEGTKLHQFDLDISWLNTVLNERNVPYLLWYIELQDGFVLYQSLAHYRLITAKLANDKKTAGVLNAEKIRETIFNPIDTLLTSPSEDDQERAVDLIVELNAAAFALLPWETKVRYLRALIEAWTNRREEEAIFEIIKSVRSASELEAIFEMLRQQHILDQLFNDLDSNVYDVLEYIGRHYGRQINFDSKYLIDILIGAGVIPAAGLLDPENELVGMANGFKTWILSNVEGLWFIISEPGKFLDALASLFEFLSIVDQAQRGNLYAIQFLIETVQSVGEKIKFAIIGANFAHETRQILTRLRYALVFEVLSWFVGIGEIKSALGAANLSERLAGLARILRLLGLAGKAAEIPEAASKIERLAAFVARALRELNTAEDAIRLIGHLPAEDVAALGRVAETAELGKAADLAHLRQLLRGQEALLHDLNRSVGNLETLARVESKLGRQISQEGAEGLQRLMSHADLSAAQVRKLVDGIADPDQLADFLSTLRHMAPERFTGANRLGMDFLEKLSSSRRTMQFLREVDIETLGRIHLEQKGDIRQVERFLDNLETLRTEQAMSASEYRRLLDRLRDGDRAAYESVELARFPAAARDALAQLRAALSGDPDALAGLERLVEKGYHDFFDDLTQFPLESSRQRLRVIKDLTDHEFDGLKAIKELERGKLIDWEDFIDLNPQGSRLVLDVVADIHPYTQSGLDRVLFEFLAKGGGRTVNEIQGSLGELLAARDALRRYMGYNRISFQVEQPGRVFDILLQGGGPDIQIEVKTNLPGARGRAKATFKQEEAEWDIIHHASDGYQHLHYLYHPEVGQGELDRVARLFDKLFDDPRIQTRLKAMGINDVNAAREAFKQQVEHGGLIDFFNPH